MNWVSAIALAGPLIAALALWKATREKKVDALAAATTAGFEGMVILTDNQREELDRFRQELVESRLEAKRQEGLYEACEKHRALDRKSYDGALVIIGELKAQVAALEKRVNP